MRTLLLLVLVCIARPASAQPVYTDSTLLLRPLYRAGDRLTYKVTQYRETEGAAATYWASQEYRLTVEIREADTSRGYLVDYEVKLVAATDKGRPLYTLQAKALDGIRFSYRLDRFGLYAGLVDTVATREYIRSRFAAASKPEGWRSVDEKAWQHELEAFQNDRELREYLAPLGLIHAGNRRLWRSNPRRVRAQRLRYHTADTARGTQDLWLERVDPERNAAIYHIAFKGLDKTVPGYDIVMMDYDYAVELNTGWLQRLQVMTTRQKRKGYKKLVIELLPSS
jgi:hypothetical protein